MLSRSGSHVTEKEETTRMRKVRASKLRFYERFYIYRYIYSIVVLSLSFRSSYAPSSKKGPEGDYLRATSVSLLSSLPFLPVVIAISRYDNSTFIDRSGRTTTTTTTTTTTMTTTTTRRIRASLSSSSSFASSTLPRRSVYGARREGDSRRLGET